MNRYPGVNSQIVNLVKKYALSLHRKLKNKIDVEDLQQELMLAAIHSLAKLRVSL